MSDCQCLETFTAEASSTASSYTRNKQLITASASATATSTLSYDDAYQIALGIAQDIAQQNADHDANVINESNLETYNATANGNAQVYANNGQSVTATATATASSTLNYIDAFEIAITNANSIARSTAQNDANIINQSFPSLIKLENLGSSNNIYNIHDNSNFYYMKGSVGNSTNMTPTFFSLGINGIINSSVIDSKGNLYIGGLFTNSSTNKLSTSNGLSTTFNNIAMWNGSTWSSLNNGVSGAVNALAIDANDNLYVGGTFKYIYIDKDNLLYANNIAKWTRTSSSWSGLGTLSSSPNTTNGVNNTVNTIAINLSNNDIYVGGSFTTVYPSTGAALYANYIAIWTGTSSSWTGLGTLNTTSNPTNNGVNSTVNTIAINLSNNDVYVGGLFTTVYPSTGAALYANYIAIWRPDLTWTGFGAALSNSLNPTNNGVNNTVNTIAINLSNNNVYIGGNFTTVYPSTGAALYANYIAIWRSNLTWAGFGAILSSSPNPTNNGVNNIVYTLVIDTSNNVYVGGSFNIAYNNSPINANRIVYWSPLTSFSTVGQLTSTVNNGLSSDVKTIYIFNNKIYVGNTTSIYQLLTDYINLYYNDNLIQQLSLNGQVTSIYTNNINGNKIAGVISINPVYQNYY